VSDGEFKLMKCTQHGNYVRLMVASSFRYMGTITGISDLDSERWPNSHWRSVKVYFGPVLLLFPLLTIQALVHHVCCKFSVEKTILLQCSLKICSLRDTYFMVLYDHKIYV